MQIYNNKIIYFRVEEENPYSKEKEEQEEADEEGKKCSSMKSALLCLDG